MGDVLRKIRTHEKFNVGDLLIYYNKWAGWEKSEHPDYKDQHWFEDGLSWEEVQALMAGDELWRSDEPYAHSMGKVYGYKLIKIEKIEKAADQVRIHHSSGFFTITKESGSSSLKTLTDEDRVYNWSLSNQYIREC